jgi:prepilin-type N-terminal cleavage/methylation domain-containing protein
VADAAPRSIRRLARGASTCRALQRAFSLVETLVAIVLVAISMLGLGALQLAALRGSGTSLDLLAAAGHAISHEERLRALHDAPPEARARLAGAGVAIGCFGDRRCTPEEFAADEAARWLDAAAPRTWQPQPPVADDASAPTQIRLEVARAAAPFVAVEVVP